MKLGSRIKMLRTQKGLTQEQFSEMFQVSKSNVSKYENGSIEPNYDLLVKIANYFGVSTDYLLGNSSDPELTAKDEKDIAKRIEEITQDLENTEVLMLHGEIMDDETKDLIKSAMETAVKISKKVAKKKFTPKKYRK